MIHSTAIIHPTAQLDAGVSVGPYSIIGEQVKIGSGTQVGAHVVIERWTEIGRDNQIFQFASVGAAPQDLKYKGEETWLVLGDRNRIREFATLHRGTPDGGGRTVVGSDNLFMAYSHVAHDCRVHNRVVMANAATLAGHVEVEDNAILGGLMAVHQFCRVGCHTMISGGAMISQDIPPYTIAQGDRAKTIGINLVGLKRRGFPEATIRGIKNAYRLMFRSGLRLEAALERIELEYGTIPEVKHFTAFIKESQRGIAR
jgi:UDP-N-acetylglucosamine acyltransferase